MKYSFVLKFIVVSILSLMLFTTTSIAQTSESKSKNPKKVEYQDPMRFYGSPTSTDPTGVSTLVQKVRKGVVLVQWIDINSGVPEGSGSICSGSIIDPEGFFMTNTHCIGQGGLIQLTGWDRKKYSASKWYNEPGIDFALGQLKNGELGTLVPNPWGDSNEIKPGDLALAMGAPGAQVNGVIQDNNFEYGFALEQTANLRVVKGNDSSLDFAIQVHTGNKNEFGQTYGTNYDTVFRMQTGINGGNSGGPLFNKYGQIIGMNTYGGGFTDLQSSNVSVPSNLAHDIYCQFKDWFWTYVQEPKMAPDPWCVSRGYGKATTFTKALGVRPGTEIRFRYKRPWVGLDVVGPKGVVTGTFMTNYTGYTEFKATNPDFYKQVTIFGVRANSPASVAGFKRGDIIRACYEVDANGNPTRVDADGSPHAITFKYSEQFRIYILRQRIGQRIKCEVIRNGKPLPAPLYLEVGNKRSYDSDFSA